MPPRIDAADWRAKAKEARTRADQATDPYIRSAMLRIAESCEHLAGIAERSAATAKLIGN